MAKQKHWKVPTSFKVHGERAGDAHQLVEGLVQQLLKQSGESAGLLLITVHRPERLRGPADTCATCKTS
jgi:hypothetical protein